MTSSQFCSHGNLWPDARRARDEAIIHATLNVLVNHGDHPSTINHLDIAAVIAAAEEPTP